MRFKNSKGLLILLASLFYGAFSLGAEGPQIKIHPFSDDLELLTVSPGANEQIKPKAIFTSLDVSYSMDNACKENDNENGGTDFSRLDILRHALGVVISTLDEQDVFSLDYFDNIVTTGIEPSTVKDLGDFNDVIFNRIEKQVKCLPRGQTAMWRALEDIVTKAKSFSELHPEFDTQIIFLTDGQPLSSNGGDRPLTNPKNGWSVEVKELLGSSKVKINVIGISSDSEKKVLESISVAGSGFLAYIHDGATVIDTIAHMLGNIKASLPDYHIVNNGQVLEWYDFDGYKTDAVRHRRPGITREILVLKGQFDNFPRAEMSLDVRSRLELYQSLHRIVNKRDQRNLYKIKEQSHELTEILFESISKRIEAQKFSHLSTRLLVPVFVTNLVETRINGILDDIQHHDQDKGQINKAIDHWSDWGEWYLTTALSAHRNQVAVNGFDRAPQEFFMSTKIADEIKKAKEKGSAIRQPNASLARAKSKRRGTSSATPPPSISNVGGGSCVGPETKVIMQDSSIKEVKDLQPGETLKSGAKVVLIIESQGLFTLAKHRELEFTATHWHPVKLDAQSHWEFPAESNDFMVQEESQQRVFNLVLDKDHYVEIEGGLKWITLGHGNQEDHVLKHPFFADMKKIQDTFVPLAVNGKVLVNNKDFRRDEENQEVIGFTGKNLLD